MLCHCVWSPVLVQSTLGTIITKTFFCRYYLTQCWSKEEAAASSSVFCSPNSSIGFPSSTSDKKNDYTFR